MCQYIAEIINEIKKTIYMFIQRSSVY